MPGATPTDVSGRGHATIGEQHIHENLGLPPGTTYIEQNNDESIHPEGVK
jgi:hypothetical protein